jgi:hypothetical protein
LCGWTVKYDGHMGPRRRIRILLGSPGKQFRVKNAPVKAYEPSNWAGLAIFNSQDLKATICPDHQDPAAHLRGLERGTGGVKGAE